ncbi:MAG: hypothetical protein J5643_03420 [Lachnospiraceae bacterium]|nr:hypothetical protein [Lachnospiraceae bacterium]
MKEKDLMDGIGTVEEDLLERSEGVKNSLAGTEKTGKKKGFTRWIAPMAAAAAVVAVITGGIFLMKSGILKKSGINLDPYADPKLKDYTIASAVYPKLSAWPDPADYDLEGDDWEKYAAAVNAWMDEAGAHRNKLIDYGMDKAIGPVAKFTASGMMNILAGQSGKNRAFSPINIYLTLAMLADVTDGSTRQQILSLTGADSAADLRTRADLLWNVLYKDDATGKCVLGSSLWLRDDSDSYDKKALENLALYYHASSFRGKMGSSAYNKAVQSWINGRTGGLLEKEVSDISFDDNTVLGLITTILYQAKWDTEFAKGLTDTGIFHAASGDREVSYMHQSAHGGLYYRGEKFIAVPKYFKNESSSFMWFILPNEGVTTDELLADTEVHRLMEKGMEGKGHSAIVHLTVPKYDIACSFKLKESLQKMGVTDVFDDKKADFSPLFKTARGFFVSDARHAIRVMVDEEGVKAAAFTELQVAGMGLSTEEIDFTLDRPFLFSIQTYDNIPLFVGVVEEP